MVRRRQVIKLGAAAGVFGEALSRWAIAETNRLFEISLAQFSLHRTYYGEHIKKGWVHLSQLLREDPAAAVAGGPDPADFAMLARTEFDIGAVEYVNQFYFAQLGNEAYFKEMARKADDHGVVSHLMMLDGTGRLGAIDAGERGDAMEKVKAWMGMAQLLGCAMVRVNIEGEGEPEERAKRTSESLDTLGEIGVGMGLAVVVENHGGLTSNGAWLAKVLSLAKHPGVGSLPDFGNFRIGKDAEGKDIWYDRYRGVSQLMPFAKAVSAKSYDFDSAGDERMTDFTQMLRIVLDAGYRGYIGIEYEGRQLNEFDGIRATQRLLQRVRAAYSSNSHSRSGFVERADTAFALDE